MPILIDKVRISNFRSIKKCEVTLSPVTLLIGANNSGKTSFLKALHFALGVGVKRVTKEDFYIGESGDSSGSKEIIIDIRIVPVDEKYKKVKEFEDIWRDKQFGELINLDERDDEFFSFRTKITYDLLNGDYSIDRYKIKTWSENPDWDIEKPEEDLKQFLDGFPLFFMDAQRDIIQDIRERSSYFGRMLNNIKIEDDLIQGIEEKIKAINEIVVANSEELNFLKSELEKIQDTVSSSSAIEITAICKKLRDIGRNININLKDSTSESFSLDYHGMGTRSWASLLTFGAFISWQYKKRDADKKPYHSLLALEEPEAHLHPHAQRSLYCQLTGMKGQKIISTHSPFIASQCNLSEIRHFKKQEAHTEVRSLEEVEQMNPEEQRKLRREVLNTRGELIFAKVVILFEGETEEEAFPIFAEKYWNKHPYEKGISFIGVGGDGNYSPFLRFLNSFEIPWFIFSDGERDALDKVEKALESIGLSKDISKNANIVALEGGLKFESYLVSEDYIKEIQKAILEFKKRKGEISNNEHERAKIKEIGKMTEEDIIKYMCAYKTKLSPIYAENIAEIPSLRNIPTKIRELFDLISKIKGI